MEFSSEKVISLIQESVEDYHDVVLVFKNPYEFSQYNHYPKFKNEEIDQYELLNLAKNIFHTQGQTQENFQQSVSDLFKSRSGQKISEQDQFKLIITRVVDVLQDYLKLDIQIFLSRDYDEIFIGCRASEYNLQVHADLIDYHLQFKNSPKYTLDFMQVPPYGPYEKKNKSDPNVPPTNKLFQQFLENDEPSENGQSVFQSRDRIRLVYSMIASVIEISELSKIGVLLQHFAVHKRTQQQDLEANWASWKNIFKPLDIRAIRNYYGERIGMYFAWLEFYAKWLVFPSLLGIIIGIIAYATGAVTNDHDKFNFGQCCVFLYGIIISSFTFILSQMWSRKQSELAWMWGSYLEGHDTEQREQYQGTFMKDPVTGKLKKFNLSTRWQRLKLWFTYTVIVTFICLVIGLIFVIFLFRATMHNVWDLRLVGFISAIQIKICNFIYTKVAVALTEWENHETVAEYQNSLALRLYLFQFVNSYASLYYIAFLKKHFEGCTYNNCVYDLENQLMAIYITYFVLNMLELGIPYLKQRLSIYLEMRRVRAFTSVRQDISYLEYQSKLEEYDTPLNDYMEFVIIYGFIINFSVVFTLATLLGFTLAVIEIRVDAIKLTRLSKRPFPHSANTIGIWFWIIIVTNIIGAATQSGVLIFTANIFGLEDQYNQWLLFLIVEHGLLILQFVFYLLIHGTSTKVERGQRWSKRVVNAKLYNKYQDVDKARLVRHLDYIRPSDFAKCNLSSVIEAANHE